MGRGIINGHQHMLYSSVTYHLGCFGDEENLTAGVLFAPKTLFTHEVFLSTQQCIAVVIYPESLKQRTPLFSVAIAYATARLSRELFTPPLLGVVHPLLTLTHTPKLCSPIGCANFSLPRPLCSGVRPDVRDRQT